MTKDKKKQPESSHRSTKLRKLALKFTILVSAMIKSTIQNTDLLEFSHRMQDIRYTFSAISFGETVVHTHRNNIYYANAFKDPYTETRINFPGSSPQYSLQISEMSPYLIVCDVLGTVYILNQNRNMEILKTMDLNAIGRARFYRSQVHGFEGTNYFYLAVRQLERVGAVFHDWTADDGQARLLNMNQNILRFCSFESVSLLLGVEEFGGVEILKNDPTASNNVLTTFTISKELGSMAHLQEIGGVAGSKHVCTTNEEVSSRMMIYNSVDDQISNEVEKEYFGSPIDLLVIKGTSYVAFSSFEPLMMALVSIPSMDVWEYDYGNGAADPEDLNYLRVIAQIKDTNYLWLGKDSEFDIYKVLPTLCHSSCETCSKGLVENGCDSCPSDRDKQGSYCILSSENCQTTQEPFFYPGTSTCANICSIGYFVEDGNICQSCIENCDSCSDKLTCENCKEGFEISDDKLCMRKCELGQYSSSPTECSDCHSSCLGCKGPSNADCTHCFELQEVNPDGTCSNICPKGMFFGGIDNGCMDCSSPCASCSSSSSASCLSCEPNLYQNPKNDGTDHVECLRSCPLGTYEDTTMPQDQCSICPDGCDQCYLGSTSNGGTKIVCSDCQEGLFFFNDRCYEECPEGTEPEVGNQKSCRGCDSNCETCIENSSGELKCQECQGDYYLLEDICYFSCPPGTYELSDDGVTKCSYCPDLCLYCDDSSTCSTCFFGYFLKDDGSCVFRDSGNQIPGAIDDEYKPTTSENETTIVLVTFFSILLVLIIGISFLIKRKARREAAERQRRRERRLLARTPLAQPFHPIVPEGYRNPLQPEEGQSQNINPQHVYATIPFEPTPSVFDVESFLEIQVNGSQDPNQGENQLVRVIQRNPREENQREDQKRKKLFLIFFRNP